VTRTLHALAAFGLLLLVSIVGFWKSYFSQLGAPSLQVTHHAHGLVMLAWVVLLIAQAWLIRARRHSIHRAVGRVSFVLAPLVVVTAVWVNLRFMGQFDPAQPIPPVELGFHWFGWFLPAAFAIGYGLAIVHRRDAARHARYMASTALVFLVPGLGRAAGNYLPPLVGWAPSPLQLMFVPLGIAAFLWLRDRRAGQSTRPFGLVTALWVLNLAGWAMLPQSVAWQTFSVWIAGLAR
jgi:uncharacterized membrane protein YozB (DUF420 family)